MFFDSTENFFNENSIFGLLNGNENYNSETPTNLIDNKDSIFCEMNDDQMNNHSIDLPDNGLYLNENNVYSQTQDETDYKHNAINIPENNFDENIQNNINNEINVEIEIQGEKFENNPSLQRKRGRKKKNEDRKNIIHSKNHKDNVIYKLKVQAMKGVYEILPALYMKKKNKKIKLNRIKGEILKDGKRSSNLELLNDSIETILKKEKSSRHKITNKSDNTLIINEIKKIREINEILKMKFIFYIENVFMKSYETFLDKYGVKNEFVFDNIQLEDEQRKIMKELASNGLLNYYDKIKGRIR